MKESDHLGELGVDGKVVVVRQCNLGACNSGYFRYITVSELIAAEASEHSRVGVRQSDVFTAR
jgi:hypothetical protein